MTSATLTIPQQNAAARSALRGRDILCFSQDWSGDPLSKTHLMRVLSRDNRILWVNSIGYRTPTVSKSDLSRAFKKLAALTIPIREVEANIFVMNPLALPLYGPAAQRINRQLLRFQIRRAMRRLRFRRSMNWVFNPAAAVIAGTLGEECLIYYCVDEFTEFTGVSKELMGDLERQLLAKSDLVIVSSQKLYESKSPLNRNTFLVRHGVDFEHFRKALDPRTQIPAEIANLPRPIIGFFGLIADWIDLKLLTQIARHFAHGSLVILGKETTDISMLRALPNVHLLGRKPYSDLPSYCKGFDVALNPFRINTLTLNANPLKVREYLAAGLPVVSTEIPEVEEIGLCRIAQNHDQFIAQIEAALIEPGPSIQRSDSICHESWRARVDVIDAHLQRLGLSSSREEGKP